MIKLFHTSDWHLGNVFHEFVRDDEHHHFLDWLLVQMKSEQPDALLIAGDVFDYVNPSAASQRLYYEFLARVVTELPGLQVIVIAGNHDSAYRLEAPDAFFSLMNVHVKGAVKRNKDMEIDYDDLVLPVVSRKSPDERLLCVAVPYLRQGDYPPAESLSESMNLFFSRASEAAGRLRRGNEPLVLMAHFYATGAEIAEDSSERIWVGGQEAVNAGSLPEDWSYVALGHIHKRQTVAGQDTVRYSGSVLPMSFSERSYRHGVECVEIGPDGQCVRRFLEYTPLRTLVSIPEEGPKPLDEVLERIRHDLPSRKMSPNESLWPYLEIRVLLDKVELQMNQKIMKILEQKAVRFCSLRVFYEEQTSARQEDNPTTLADLNAVTALDVARIIYKRKYHLDMPEELETLFNEAYEAALKDISDENN